MDNPLINCVENVSCEKRIFVVLYSTRRYNATKDLGVSLTFSMYFLCFSKNV